MLLTSKTSYFITNHYLGRIYLFDENWNFAALTESQSFPNAAFMMTINGSFFIKGDAWIWKTDLLFTILHQFSPSVAPGYRGSYYNCTNNILYVAGYKLNSIQLFDLNLTSIGEISTNSFYTYSVSAYENEMFVGTTNGKILVILNNIITNTFSGCNGNSVQLLMFLIDEFDNMMTSCDNQNLYLYNINGSYTNKQITPPSSASFIGFDSKLRFLTVSYGSGIYIYN